MPDMGQATKTAPPGGAVSRGYHKSQPLFRFTAPSMYSSLGAWSTLSIVGLLASIVAVSIWNTSQRGFTYLFFSMVSMPLSD